MTTGTSEPPESEIVLDSRKAKVVALFAAAPGAALLFYVLPRGTLPLDAAGRVLWALAGAVLLTSAVIPLYCAIKIWLRPTLGNLRRVPFIAAFWFFFGRNVIYRILVDFEWISFKDTIPELLVDLFNLIHFPLTLGAYFLVRYAMVLWFKTPELAQPGLKTGTRTTLWRVFCFFLWAFLQRLGNNLVEHFYSAGSQDYPPEVPFLIQMVVFVICVYLAMFVYKKGLRPFGLRPD